MGGGCGHLDGGSSLRWLASSRSSPSRFVISFPAPGDVPMSRVKFDARQEYEYLSNFKILQNYFKAKKIDKVSL